MLLVSAICIFESSGLSPNHTVAFLFLSQGSERRSYTLKIRVLRLLGSRCLGGYLVVARPICQCTDYLHDACNTPTAISMG